jgi:hypothetical protein
MRTSKPSGFRDIEEHHDMRWPQVSLAIVVASACVSAVHPAMAAAESRPSGLSGSAGRTAAQVSSRLVIDDLSAAGPSQDGQPTSSDRNGMAGTDATPGAETIALASLHLPAAARAPAPAPAPPRVAPTTNVATTAPVVSPDPAPAPTPAPTTPTVPTLPTVPTAAAVPGVDTWARLRQCESGGNYIADTGNGYYGAYQFSAATWHGLGYPGLPNQAAPAVQDQAAERLQARSGWGQWPTCSRRLGL